MKGFRAGLRCRSPLVLLVAAGLSALAILGVQHVFTGGLWATLPLGVWVRTSHDTASSVYVSWTVTRLRSQEPAKPMACLLGGSAAREATVDNGDSLAASVHRGGGPRVIAHNLATPVQTFAQNIIMLSNLPEGTPTTVIIGVSPGRFASGVAARRRESAIRGLLLWDDTFQAYLDANSIDQRVLPPIVDALQMLAVLLREDVRVLWSGRWPRTQYVQHKWDSAPIRSDAAMNRKADVWVKAVKPRFNVNVEFNLRMLDELIDRCQKRGFDVVLVELPRNTEVIGERWDDMDAVYKPRLREIAAERAIHYLDFNDRLNLPSEAFFDTHHMRPAGRVAWERALSEELVRLYRAGELQTWR